MIDKEALLKARLPEREVELPGLGTIRVRGMSRSEALGLKKVPRDDVAAVERYMLRHGLVDPVLTPEEIAQWQDVSPAKELDLVVDAIADLSGVKEAAPREAYDQFRDDGRDGDGVRPSGEAGDDGGPPA